MKKFISIYISLLLPLTCLPAHGQEFLSTPGYRTTNTLKTAFDASDTSEIPILDIQITRKEFSTKATPVKQYLFLSKLLKDPAFWDNLPFKINTDTIAECLIEYCGSYGDDKTEDVYYENINLEDQPQELRQRLIEAYARLLEYFGELNGTALTESDVYPTTYPEKEDVEHGLMLRAREYVDKIWNTKTIHEFNSIYNNIMHQVARYSFLTNKHKPDENNKQYYQLTIKTANSKRKYFLIGLYNKRSSAYSDNDLAVDTAHLIQKNIKDILIHINMDLSLSQVFRLEDYEYNHALIVPVHDKGVLYTEHTTQRDLWPVEITPSYSIIPPRIRGYTMNKEFKRLTPITSPSEHSYIQLAQKALQSSTLPDTDGPLIAGDYALQALNQLVSQKNDLSTPVDTSSLLPILTQFDQQAFDTSGSTKQLIKFLSTNQYISKTNIDKLAQCMNDINNMNERTEISTRIIRHQIGHDLFDPANKLLNMIYSEQRKSNPIAEKYSRYADYYFVETLRQLYDMTHTRIEKRKDDSYSSNEPTMSISETALWRKTIYAIAAWKNDESFNTLSNQHKNIKNPYYQILYLFTHTSFPLISGTLPKFESDLIKIAHEARARAGKSRKIDNIENKVFLSFTPDAETISVYGEKYFIREMLQVLMENSILVAIERLEDQNAGRGPDDQLTLEDRPIELAISFSRDIDGSVSIQVIEVCDNVGGISDPEMLEETYPGSGRQNITRINTSRRKKDTGFGLAFVWHIVNMHGGTFWIENRETEAGKGIRAVIKIPGEITQPTDIQSSADTEKSL